MRRIAGIAIALLSAGALLVVAPGADDVGDYKVRAIFDNGAFLAPGMDVRVAGANVGSVAELDVTLPDEAARLDGSDEPGKAVVVMQINDAGFQDWRQDASCLIHAQSLLGEKFVDCEPTQERAAGTEAPPELEVIPEGERGEGQRLLPLEQNGKAVDLDLVNNIMREPYPDRFRLILNDLGAGLAARGDELGEIIERGNPALRETNEVLEKLARQNQALESLASDSDAIMTELAAERERVASFINESTTVGEATLARRAELEETFERFPGFLRELRSTMVELRGFSDAAEPVFGDLRVAAPALTRVNEVLTPFSNATTTSLTTLGDAAVDAGPAIKNSDPVVRQTRNLARASKRPVKELSLLLSTMRQTGGFQGLLETLFGLGGTLNAFDEYGHFTRALIPRNSCFDYVSSTQAVSCEAKFRNFETASSLRASELDLERAQLSQLEAAESAEQGGGQQKPHSSGPSEPSEPEDAEPLEPETDEPVVEDDDLNAAATKRRSMRTLLDFLVGPAVEGGAR